MLERIKKFKKTKIDAINNAEYAFQDPKHFLINRLMALAVDIAVGIGCALVVVAGMAFSNFVLASSCF